jgi:hypothetical protein
MPIVRRMESRANGFRREEIAGEELWFELRKGLV